MPIKCHPAIAASPLTTKTKKPQNQPAPHGPFSAKTSGPSINSSTY